MIFFKSIWPITKQLLVHLGPLPLPLSQKFMVLIIFKWPGVTWCLWNYTTSNYQGSFFCIAVLEQSYSTKKFAFFKFFTYACCVFGFFLETFLKKSAMDAISERLRNQFICLLSVLISQHLCRSLAIVENSWTEDYLGQICEWKLLH